LICDGKTDIYNPNVIRASLGAVFCVKIVQTTNESALKFLKDQKIKLCVTTPSATTLYMQANLNEPLAVILGSEQKGLNDFWIKHSDMNVRIPMKGRGDSLNVSTTAAIVLYEALRQRGAYGV
jgi:TrmH family RNA methyltransferase